MRKQSVVFQLTSGLFITALMLAMMSPAMAAEPGKADAARHESIRWNAQDLSWSSENRFLADCEEEGWIVPNPRWWYIEAVEDPTVPFYGPVVCGRLFREGAPAGHGFGLRRHLPEGGSRVLHMGVLLKISDNFVNDAANLTKIFYLWSNHKSKAVLSVVSGQHFELGFNLRHAPGVVPGYLMANVVPRDQARLTPGQWHVVEFRVESASRPEMGDEADGRIRVWLDGVLTHNYQDQDTHFEGERLEWQYGDWNTIRGGVGPDNPHDMWWYAGALFAAANPRQAASAPQVRRFPNEPDGFVPRTEFNFQWRDFGWPAATADPQHGRGDWWAPRNFVPERMELVRDPDAPLSPDYYRWLWPEGLRGGVGPGYGITGWHDIVASGHSNRGSPLDHIFHARAVRLVDSGDGQWESHPAGTKLGWFGVGECGSGGSQNELYAFLQGGLRSEFTIRLIQQGPPNSPRKHGTQNVKAGPVMRVGQWHLWEMEMIKNTPGQADGVLRWWIDGELIMEHRDMEYVTENHPCGFRSLGMRYVWGGVGGERSRDDWLDVSHVYVSSPAE